MGRSQVVRLPVLVRPFGGSSPSAPDNSIINTIITAFNNKINFAKNQI